MNKLEKEENIKVSIIIPIHNSEKYLAECIESVLAQTFKNLEILCVDGGSSDSSFEIIKRLKEKDKRIVYIHDSNTSYGHKLNVGIERAKGSHIGILESDDKMLPNMVEYLYKVSKENNSDIVDADYYEFFLYGGVEYKYVQVKYPDSEYDNQLTFDKGGTSRTIATRGIWTALYRKEFLEQKRIRLNESPGASFQDTSFMFLTSYFAESVIHLNMPLYQYRIDNTNSSVKDCSKIFEIVGECEFLKKNLDEQNICDKEAWELYYIRKYTAFYWNYCRLSAETRGQFLNAYYDELKQDIKKGYINRRMFKDSLYKRTYLLIDDKDEFINLVSKNDRKTFVEGFATLLDKIKERDVVVFGAGKLGSRLAGMLLQHKNKVCGICDNFKQGMENNGFIVVSVETATKQFRHAHYLIASQNHAEKMKKQLIDEGIKEADISIYM